MCKKWITAIFISTLCLFTFSGCGRSSADEYVGEMITSLKEDDSTKEFSPLLEEAIEKNEPDFALEFPEDLKEPYLDFMQTAFQTMDFEVEKAEKQEDNTYSVQVSFQPVDLEKTLSDSDDRYTSTLASSDLSAETAALLKKDEELLKDNPSMGSKTQAKIIVTKKDDSFSISEKERRQFLEKALTDYMHPYNTVCDPLNAQDFMRSYLDASFKGEVSQFAKHTNRTEEQAQDWYEADVFTPPSDLNASYTKRYKAALKKIMKQCKYTVGIPTKQEGLYDYTLTVTYTPNNSLKKIFSDLQKGTYYSTEQVSKSFVEIMEKYAKKPSYGKETSMDISLNLTNILNSSKDGSEYQKLGEAILPTI